MEAEEEALVALAADEDEDEDEDEDDEAAATMTSPSEPSTLPTAGTRACARDERAALSMRR